MERIKFRTTSSKNGKIEKIFVKTGEKITKDQQIFSIDMESKILIVRSHIDGIIEKIHVNIDQKIHDKDVLCDILTIDEVKKRVIGEDKNKIDEISKIKIDHEVLDEKERNFFEKELISIKGNLKENHDVFSNYKNQNEELLNQVNQSIFQINDRINKISRNGINSNSDERMNIFEGKILFEVKRNDDRIKSLQSIISKIGNKSDDIEKKIEDAIGKNAEYDVNQILSRVKILSDELNSLKNKYEFHDEQLNNLDISYDDSRIMAKIKATTDNLFSLKTKLELLESNDISYKFDEKIENVNKYFRQFKEQNEKNIAAIRDDIAKLIEKSDSVAINEKKIDNFLLKNDFNKINFKSFALFDDVKTLATKLKNIEERVDNKEDYVPLNEFKNFLIRLKEIENFIKSSNKFVTNQDIKIYNDKLNDASKKMENIKETFDSKLSNGYLSKSDFNKINFKSFASFDDVKTLATKLKNIEERVDNKEDYVPLNEFKNFLIRLKEIENFIKSSNKFVTNQDIKIYNDKLNDASKKMENIKETFDSKLSNGYLSKSDFDKIDFKSFALFDDVKILNIKLDELIKKDAKNNKLNLEFVKNQDLDNLNKRILKYEENERNNFNEIESLKSQVSYLIKINQEVVKKLENKPNLKHIEKHIEINDDKVFKITDNVILLKEDVRVLTKKVNDYSKKIDLKIEDSKINQTEPIFNEDSSKTKTIKISFSLNKLMNYLQEDSLAIQKVEQPFRIDLMFYKAIENSIRDTKIIEDGPISLPKMNDDRSSLIYRDLNIYNKTIQEIYEQSIKLVKNSKAIRSIIIADDAVKEKVSLDFKNNSNAKMLVILGGIVKRNSIVKIVVDFSYKNEIAEPKILEFIDKITTLINSPNLIK